MLDRLASPARDPLWAIASEFGADTRAHKIDLVVGVYRDEHGRTPVMQAVSAAESRLAAQAPSKSYKGLAGHREFNRLMTALLLEPTPAHPRAATLQTVGGTGALRLLADLVAWARPGATLWIGTPGYVNHEPIARAAGLEVRHYPYLGPDGRVDEPAMLRALARARTDDVVVLHGCCHNPSGVDLAPSAWQALSRLVSERGLIPLVDMAYLGLGDGVEGDLAGLHLMASQVEQMFVAASCSKNMGLYSERTGCAVVLGRTAAAAASAMAAMEHLARANYSMPPDHGAAVAALVLGDPALHSVWRAELAAMRERIVANREALAAAFAARCDDSRLLALREHRGMFSTLPLQPAQMARLRLEHAVYGTDSGRINIAGLRAGEAARVAEAVLAVV